MTVETVNLLLNWLETGTLLVILFRLSSTFQLIANTQRELRRAIHHLAEQRDIRPNMTSAFGNTGAALRSRPVPDPDDVEIQIDGGDFGPPIAVR